MSCSDEYYSNSNSQNIIQISPSTKSRLEKAKYGVFNHSAVEICHWTKKALLSEGTCYKHKFYGISTHRCMEMTPAAMNCENRCVYCWRPAEFYDTLHMPEDLVDEPDAIVKNLLHERYRLIVGYYGNQKADKNKIDESLLPEHYAISLSGEPTMYPKLPQLIKYLKTLENTKSIFLVTNGQEPEMLKKLVNENALPTQIYLSTNASNRKMFNIINRPRYKDAWQRWNDSLLLLSKMNTRTVIRTTLIRGYNESLGYMKEFAEILRIGNPHFIELKSYMHIGMSTSRLEKSSMLEMDEIREYSVELKKYLDNFTIMDESEISRIMVLQNNKRFVNRWIDTYSK
jgi:tRNA wybutosine-synthesizing protein 1